MTIQRLQIGAVWQESSITTTGFTAQSRNIIAGSFVVGFLKAETANIEINQTVIDTAGGLWTVVRSYFGSVNSHIMYSYNHPGGTNVVISGTFTGGTVVTAETKIRFAEFDGEVGETNPVLQAIPSGGNNLQLSHTHNVPVDGFTLAAQGSYYGVAFTLTSPATLLAYAYNTMNASIQRSSGPAVLHSGGGGSGQQANISITVAPIDEGVDITPPVITSPVATPTSSSLTNWQFTTNEIGGTAHAIVGSSTPPTAAAIISGGVSVAVGGLTPSGTGLSYTAGQYIHMVQQDAADPPNISNVLSVLIADTAVPTATGPLTISNVTPTGCRISGFSATDNIGIVGWRYRLDSGSWITFGNSSTTFVDLTGLTTDDTLLFELQASDASSNWSNTLSKTIVVGATTVTVSGLRFETGGASGTAASTLQMNPAPPITPLTYIWWERLRSSADGYYRGGFIIHKFPGSTFRPTETYVMPVLHGTDGTFNTSTGQRTALAASPFHHEIATDGLDFIASPPGLVRVGETQESYPAEYSVWRMRAMILDVVGADFVMANHIDLENPTKVIRHAYPASEITATARAMYLGKVPWTSEYYYADVFGLGVYQGAKTVEECVSELMNFSNTPLLSNCYFRNVFPALVSGELPDLKGFGTPHPFELITAAQPGAFTDEIEVATGPQWEDLPGETGTSYTTPPLTTDMNGWQYRWVATNAQGSATSAIATQTVTLPSIGIKYWNGSSWVLKTLKYWDSSNWVVKQPKYWNGTSWV